MAKLIKIAKMLGVMHEADHTTLSRAPGDCSNYLPMHLS